MLQNFEHLSWPSIVYLSCNLFASDDPNSGFPEPGTSLFVIDKLDELIDKEAPRDLPEDSEEKRKRGTKPPEALLNYWKTAHHAMRMLKKFAAKHNVAVVVLTPIDVQDQRMCPAIDTQAWDEGVATRIMLWRQDMGDEQEDVRLGRTVKKDGVEEKGEVFGFNVTEVSLTIISKWKRCRALPCLSTSSLQHIICHPCAGMDAAISVMGMAVLCLRSRIVGTTENAWCIGRWCGDQVGRGQAAQARKRRCCLRTCLIEILC